MREDIHCHILPEVDDGAQSLEVSQKMLSRAQRAGIRHIVATSHLYAQADAQDILKAFQVFEPIAQSAGIRLTLGYEVNWRAIVKLNPTEYKRFCIGDTGYLLLELPSRSMLPNWEYVIGGMCRAYTPIIAHPERLPYIQRNFELARELRDLGCRFQLDAYALCGMPLSAEKRTAKRFLTLGLADYVASDAHSEAEYDLYEKAYKKYAKIWPKGTLEE